jgi:hypothetical protein
MIEEHERWFRLWISLTAAVLCPLSDRPIHSHCTLCQYLSAFGQSFLLLFLVRLFWFAIRAQGVTGVLIRTLLA